jgi:hypothetical protein
MVALCCACLELSYFRRWLSRLLRGPSSRGMRGFSEPYDIVVDYSAITPDSSRQRSSGASVTSLLRAPRGRRRGAIVIAACCCGRLRTTFGPDAANA